VGILKGYKMSELSLEQQLAHHAHMLAVIGKQLGYPKITDKTKWREPIMAGILGHKAFENISAGKNSDKYGADAIDESTGIMSEYKTKSIKDNEIRNLVQKVKNKNKGTKFSPLTVPGVYNGAYTHEAVDAYEKHNHYFGVFYDELCVLIIKPHKAEVMKQLREELDRRANLGDKKQTSNLNTVTINLGDTHLYEVAYRNDKWFTDNA
jgi:hypothetical protein